VITLLVVNSIVISFRALESLQYSCVILIDSFLEVLWQRFQVLFGLIDIKYSLQKSVRVVLNYNRIGLPSSSRPPLYRIDPPCASLELRGNVRLS